MSIETKQLHQQKVKEIPEIVEKGLKDLNSLIVSETSLQFPKEDPEFLLRFLRWSEWDLQKAFDRVKKYYQSRNTYSREYEAARPTKLNAFYGEKVHCILPKLDKNGCGILYTTFANWNTDKFDPNVYFGCLISMFEKLADSADSQMNGVAIVSNCNGISGKQAIEGSTLVYKFIDLILLSIPLKISEIHMITDQPLFVPVVKMLIAASPERLKKRYHIYGDLNSLHEKLDVDLLPAELGGHLPSLDCDAYAKEMLEWEPRWNKISKYGNPANN